MRCEKCGKDYDSALENCPYCGASSEYGGKTLFFQNAKSAKIGVKDIFSDLFKKHPEGTAARTFAAGSPTTTPTPDRMLAEWQKPWLFLRVLVAGILFIVLSYILSLTLNQGMVMVVWSFGSLVIPWAVLIFVWEFNIPHDISIVKVFAVFFVGGILSICATGLLNFFALSSEAYFAAFIEEPAKLLIAVFFIHKFKVKYGFGGLLIGCAVGVGFAVFENIAYIFNSYDVGGIGDGTFVFLLRAFLSVGSHGIWASLYGCAIALGRNCSTNGIAYLKKPLTYISVVFSTILHFVWNGGLGKISFLYIGIIIVLGYIFFGFLVKKCLKQVIAVHDMSCALHEENAVDAADISENSGAVKLKTKKVAGYIIHSDILQDVEFAADKVVMIGRDAKTCNLVVPSECAGVSRKHAAVCVSDEGVPFVMDMGSSNGTYLNDKKRIQSNDWVVAAQGFYLATETNRFFVEPIIH